MPSALEATPRQSICDVGSGCPAALSHVAPQSLDTQMPLFRAVQATSFWPLALAATAS